ncbi:Hpt domain-containing protein [Paraburkholderia sp. RL17-373-BIF-A]|uniref:Hpt domain-containing protein n=1 Tax=Paraburkholderia sp. RL17-373-BIF-A TaxID=3031629 RepID=UPI0038B83F4D
MKAADAMDHTVFSADAHLLWQKALDLACGDHATAGRLLEMISQTNRTTLDSLCEGSEVACWDSVGSAAHRIAGSARMLECHDLIALLIQLETAARAHDIAAATAVLPCVIDAIEELDVSIAKALGNGDQIGPASALSQTYGQSVPPEPTRIKRPRPPFDAACTDAVRAEDETS